MAKNYIQPGEVLDYTAADAAVSGNGVLIGKRLGVALSNAEIGDVVPLQVKGVFRLPKLTTDAPSIGTALYWDDINKRLTTTVGSNTLAGFAAAPAINGDTTVNISLNA